MGNLVGEGDCGEGKKIIPRIKLFLHNLIFDPSLYDWVVYIEVIFLFLGGRRGWHGEYVSYCGYCNPYISG